MPQLCLGRQTIARPEMAGSNHRKNLLGDSFYQCDIFDGFEDRKTIHEK
jgi:hypothetical protein